MHDGKYVVIHDRHSPINIYDGPLQAKARAGLGNLDLGEDVYRVYRLVEVSSVYPLPLEPDGSEQGAGRATADAGGGDETVDRAGEMEGNGGER